MTRRHITAISDKFVRVVQILHSRLTVIMTGAEFLLLTALYAIFMFTDKVPLAGLVALGLLWVVRWRVTGRLTVATPMDAPILGILALLPVSLYASVDWNLSLPKVYGLILGVAIYYAIVNAIHAIRRVELAVAGLILLSAAVALLGLVGADWPNIKLFSLSQVYEHLPRLIRGVARSTAGGIQPNIVGGALTFFIPLLAGLLWAGREFKAMRFVKNARLSSILRALYRPILISSLVLASITLILTQSRGSFIGVAAGLLALALWHDRRFLWAIPMAALGIFVMVRVWGGGSLVEFMLHTDISAGGNTLQLRTEIWQRAVYMIQDFPFTGIGIGTFGPVAQALYPIFSTNAIIPHAHNMLLAVAVDLGIPGLVLYIALLSCFGFSAWKAYQVVDRSFRVLIVGVACGMLAHQIFGLTDAFMLGTKLGAVMWIFFGLVAALYVRREKLARQLLEDMAGDKGGEISGPVSGEHDLKVGSKQALSRLGNFLLAFTYWVLFSLLAIAFIGDRPYLGLVIALAGGIILGFICTVSFESKAQKGAR
jgi:putative inorganic carbon (HCO3(-)) transporter